MAHAALHSLPFEPRAQIVDFLDERSKRALSSVSRQFNQEVRLYRTVKGPLSDLLSAIKRHPEARGRFKWEPRNDMFLHVLSEEELLLMRSTVYGLDYNPFLVVQPRSSYLTALPGLTHLTLHDFNQPIDDLAGLFELKSLTFGYRFNQSIQPLAKLTNLTHLTFSNGFDQPIEALAGLPVLPILPLDGVSTGQLSA